jgi:hypothetical protein
MLAFDNPRWRFQAVMVAVIVWSIWLWAPDPLPAQTPLEQAWSFLQAGAANKSDDQRVATIRVMQLIPGMPRL